MTYGEYGSSLRDLPRLRTSRRRRASSWDRSGGNDDRLTVQPGQTAVLADVDGAGLDQPHLVYGRHRRRARPGRGGGRLPAPAGAPDQLGRPGAPQRAGPARRLLRRRARPHRQLQLGPAADEPAGRQGLQLLVPHAVRRACPGRAGQRDGRAAGLLLLLRRLRALRLPGRRARLLPRPVAPGEPDRRAAAGHREHPAVPGRGHQPHRGRQLRDPRRRRPRPLRRLCPERPQPA